MLPCSAGSPLVHLLLYHPLIGLYGLRLMHLTLTATNNICSFWSVFFLFTSELYGVLWLEVPWHITACPTGHG